MQDPCSHTADDMKVMTNSIVYTSDKVRKTILYDKERQLGVRLENLVCGSVRTAPADKTVIVWSENRRSSKHTFDTSSAPLFDADERGHEARDALFCVRTRYEQGADGALIKRVSVQASRDIFIHSVTVDALPSCGGAARQAPLLPHPLIPAAVARLGQPVYVGDLFMGLESPVGDNVISGGEAKCVYHTGRKFSAVAADGVYALPPCVLGAAKSAEEDALDDAFYSYISAWARPTRFRIQFNSWYDNMSDITPSRIESSFTAVAEGLRKGGLRAPDCYVIDDGWTDYTAPKFWAFNDKFADGFGAQSDLCKKLGSAFGVWFGPRGGYSAQTFGFAMRLTKLGYHVNPVSRDICTADPRYIRDLTDKMCEFCRLYDVRYFKIDGFAKRPCPCRRHGHPPASRDVIAFYTFLWEEWTKGLEKVYAACPDVCINITSYAHCSPWFLRHADFVWMNNAADMGYSGSGDDLAMCLTYRDARYRDLFMTRGYRFPAARLYGHEPCYALLNRNTAKKQAAPVTFTDEQFRTYMRCCLMRGSGLAELYFSPAMMDGDKWKIAAETLAFAERNFEVLSASRFFGGDPEKGEVYGYRAQNDDSYAIMLRNPGNSPKNCSVSLPDAGKTALNLAPYEIRFFTNLT